MGTYPKDPSQAVARVIKEHHKKITRIEARLDQAQSDRSKDASDITANTTAITAIGTGTGGTAEQNFLGLFAQAAVASPAAGDSAQADFLGNLAQMANIANASTTGIGVLTAGGTGWTTTQVGYINTINTTLNALVNLVNSLLSEEQSGNYMAT
jgi:hypothetical protein